MEKRNGIEISLLERLLVIAEPYKMRSPTPARQYTIERNMLQNI